MQTKFGWRLLAVLAVLAFVVAACTDDGGETTTTAAGETTTTAAGETTTTAAGETTTTAAGETTTTTEAPPEATYVNLCMDDVEYSTEPYAGEPPEITTGGFIYRTGMFSDITTDNYWNYGDPGSSVYTGYVLGNTKPALFGLDLPGLEVVAGLATTDDPGVASDNGDGTYSVTVAMRQDAVWSDGTPITAHDVVFTADTVCRLGLGGNWLGWYQWAQADSETGELREAIGLTAVEAVDDYTVKFTWNALPGLAYWPHGPGLGSVMPMHVWDSYVQEAKASDDPATALYGYAGVADVSGGPVIFASWEAGAFAQNVANPSYYDTGAEITSGGVTYTVGPYLSSHTFDVYGDQSAAVLALKAGEVDFLYNSLGLQRGLLEEITSDPNLTAIINPSNGHRYMAFNLRREPMAHEGFRDAVALMIDKELVTESILQNVAYPLYATVPAGNVAWFNQEMADEFAAQFTDLETAVGWDGEPFVDLEGNTYVASGTEARLHTAVKALLADGFSWPEGQTPDFSLEGGRGGAIIPGSGIMLDGEPVGELEIIGPGPGYDPLRATFGIIIAQAISDLGFDCRFTATDFNVLLTRVYEPNPDDPSELDFDMYLLGWSLGNPVLPGYHESFYASSGDALLYGGNNAAGWSNPDFDALVQEFNLAQTFEEAYDIMWQMEAILFDEKPVIPLFDTGIIEAYRSASVQYPFSDLLSGLQFGNGLPELVQPAAE